MPNYTTFQDFIRISGVKELGLDAGTVKGIWASIRNPSSADRLETGFYVNGQKFCIEDNKVVRSNQSSEQPEDIERPEDYSWAVKYMNKVKNSHRRDIEFNLTFNQFKKIMQRKTCFYTGIKLRSVHDSREEFDSPTIDRIDPEVGYEMGNVVVCCFAANQLKSKLERSDTDGLELKHKLKLMAKMLEVM